MLALDLQKKATVQGMLLQVITKKSYFPLSRANWNPLLIFHKAGTAGGARVMIGFWALQVTFLVAALGSCWPRKP